MEIIARNTTRRDFLRLLPPKQLLVNGEKKRNRNMIEEISDPYSNSSSSCHCHRFMRCKDVTEELEFLLH
jgi:hypothetical protein